MNKLSNEELKDWERQLLNQHPGLQPAINRLESPDKGKPCDHSKLMALLHRVSRSRSEEWKRLSRSDVQQRIDVFEEALAELDLLANSELRREVLPGSDVGSLEVVGAGVRCVLEKLRAIKPKTEKRYTPRTDSAIAGVVKYVLKQTKAPHDSEVGKLIGAVLAKPMHMKRWRQVHQHLLESKS